MALARASPRDSRACVEDADLGCPCKVLLCSRSMYTCPQCLRSSAMSSGPFIKKPSSRNGVSSQGRSSFETYMPTSRFSTATFCVFTVSAPAPYLLLIVEHLGYLRPSPGRCFGHLLPFLTTVHAFQCALFIQAVQAQLKTIISCLMR